MIHWSKIISVIISLSSVAGASSVQNAIRATQNERQDAVQEFVLKIELAQARLEELEKHLNEEIKKHSDYSRAISVKKDFLKIAATAFLAVTAVTFLLNGQKTSKLFYNSRFSDAAEIVYLTGLSWTTTGLLGAGLAKTQEIYLEPEQVERLKSEIFEVKKSLVVLRLQAHLIKN